MMSIGLDSADLELILKVFAAHPRLERVTLYGSRAKGTHRKGSDIDLVLSGQGFTERDLSRLEGELDDLLLPYTFDAYNPPTNSATVDLSGRCALRAPEGARILRSRWSTLRMMGLLARLPGLTSPDSVCLLAGERHDRIQFDPPPPLHRHRCSWSRHQS